MNIHELYVSGVSSARTRFLMNPLRRIIFKLMRPYFNQLIAEFDKLRVQPSLEHRVNTVETRMHATSKDLEAIIERFNPIEFELKDHFAQICDIRNGAKTKDFTLVNTEYGFLMLKRGEVISEAIMTGRYWDSHIVSLASDVAKQRSGVAIDVGGHFGSSAVAFSHFFPKVICFEPNDFNFRVLRATLILNGIENIAIHNNGLYSRDVALSMADESTQEIPLPLDSSGYFDGSSSDNLGAYSFSEKGSGLFQHSARTLDSYRLSDVVFIKIDVQGADGEVIFGAMSTISNCLPVIVFEWEMNLSQNYSVDFGDIETRLRNIGYVIDKLKVHNSKQTDYVCIPPWFKR